MSPAKSEPSYGQVAVTKTDFSDSSTRGALLVAGGVATERIITLGGDLNINTYLGRLLCRKRRKETIMAGASNI